MVEISGSWRVGWNNKSHSEMGGDKGYASTVKYDVFELSGNRWKSARSIVKRTHFSAFSADVNATDAATRWFTFKSLPIDFPVQSYDLVMEVNGVERFRRLCSPSDSDLRSSPIEIALPPGTLAAGVNEFV